MKGALLTLLVLLICGYIYFMLFIGKACGGPGGETGLAICSPGFRCEYETENHNEQGKCVFTTKVFTF